MKSRLLPFLLLLLAALPGAAQQKITPGEAAAWLARTPGARVLDLRRWDRYALSHLPGAESLPLDSAFRRKAAALPRNVPLLVYGRGGEESRAGAEKLRRLGFRNLRWIEGGLNGWYTDGRRMEGLSRLGLSRGEYEKMLLGTDVVLVDFRADWCGYCPPVTEAAEKLGRTCPGLKVFVVDTDENPDLTAALVMHRLPALILYQQGRPVWFQVGYLPEAEIARKVRRALEEQLPTVPLPVPVEEQ